MKRKKKTFEEEEKYLMRKKAILKRNLVCTLGYRELCVLSVMSSKPYTSVLPSYVIDSFLHQKLLELLKALPRSSLSSTIENFGDYKTFVISRKELVRRLSKACQD